MDGDPVCASSFDTWLIVTTLHTLPYVHKLYMRPSESWLRLDFVLDMHMVCNPSYTWSGFRPPPPPGCDDAVHVPTILRPLQQHSLLQRSP